MHTQRPIPATIAAVIRDGQVLLVRRANPPDQGRWAFPGGKIELGERIEDARELFEETGVTAEPLTVFDAVDVFDHDADGRCAATTSWWPCCAAGSRRAGGRRRRQPGTLGASGRAGRAGAGPELRRGGRGAQGGGAGGLNRAAPPVIPPRIPL